MPTMAVWMPETAVQMSPPLKLCGVCVSRIHISDSLPFQSVRALSRMLTIQLSLIENHLLVGAKSIPLRFHLTAKTALHFFAPPLPLKTASLGFERGPKELRPTVRRNSLFRSGPAHTTPITPRISLANAIIKPPNRQRKPWVRWLASWD